MIYKKVLRLPSNVHRLELKIPPGGPTPSHFPGKGKGGAGEFFNSSQYFFKIGFDGFHYRKALGVYISSLTLNIQGSPEKKTIGKGREGGGFWATL